MSLQEQYNKLAPDEMKFAGRWDPDNLAQAVKDKYTGSVKQTYNSQIISCLISALLPSFQVFNTSLTMKCPTTCLSHTKKQFSFLVRYVLLAE